MQKSRWEYVQKFIKSKVFKTFCWQVLNSFIGLLIVFIGGLNVEWAVVIIPALMAISKHINKVYLSEYNL